MTPDAQLGNEQFTEEELRAGIQEAHKAGRKTATHAQGTQGILNALRAGTDGIEHGIFLNEEAIQAATQIAAKVLGLENELGTIGEGNLADLIVVEGNPLEDVGRLAMQGGKLVKGQR